MPSPPRTCEFSELFRAEGWTVPGLRGATKEKATTFSNPLNLEVTQLRPSRASGFLDWAFCLDKAPGRLEIVHTPIRVKLLYSYAIGGHVFAYYVGYVCQSFDRGVRVDAGCEAGMFWIDVDGSGRFTVEHAPDKKQDVPPLIPDWVQQAATPQ